MFKLLARGATAVAMVSLALGAENLQACCFSHCFDCFKPKETTFAPAPACDVCPQQVNYVPQTSYRTEYTCVPCTSYRPVSTCDACGGAQTAMQPVTSYVRKPVLVPYTSYRPVVTRVNYAAPACTTCGAAYSSPYYTGGANYAPAAVAAPTTGCATCNAQAAGYASPATMMGPTGMASPALYTGAPQYAAQPGYQMQPGYAAQPGYQMQQPGYSIQQQPGATMQAPPGGMQPPVMNGTPTPAPPENQSAPNKTFDPNTPSGSSSNFPVQPIPDTSSATPSSSNSASAPRLLDPRDRTTSTGTLIGPATVGPAIFNTADRPLVFHPATLQTTQKPLSSLSNQQATQPAQQAKQAPTASSDNWSSAAPASTAQTDNWSSATR
ncbi:MAG TPA: hypothetical protein VGJ15_09760 [Pirellulales bacterium]